MKGATRGTGSSKQTARGGHINEHLRGFHSQAPREISARNQRRLEAKKITKRSKP